MPYLFTLFFLFLFPLISLAATVEGIVIDEGGPVENSVVKAFKTANDLSNNTNGISSSRGQKPGQYKMELSPGKYYIAAYGKKDMVSLFSYHGLNPISVAEDSLWLPFFATPAVPARCESGFQGIGGRVLYKGAPLSSGSVSVYSIEDEPYRGMGVLTNTIASSEGYWFDLEPGRYVVIARQRQDSDSIGPLHKGDLFCYSAANPISVSPAQSCEVDLFCYPRNKIESFLAAPDDDPRGQREESRRQISLEAATLDDAKDRAGSGPKAIIAGRVTDSDGRPVSNLFVTAYPADDLSLFQMYIIRFKSDFIIKSDSNGLFRLEVVPGSYYLVAREKAGEAPISGEYYGLYENSPNHSLNVAADVPQKGIQIIVEPVMP